MPFVRAASLSAFPPGTTAQTTVQGREYAVCNAGGTFFVLDGICPHAGGPLGHGALHDYMLVCPWHAWEFDCRTGENDFDPSVRVGTHQVRIEGDDILIETT